MGIYSMIFTTVLLTVFVVYCTADANSKLKKCCAKNIEKGDDKDCITRFCDFDGISQANVLNFLSTCTERGATVGRMWDCASSRVDHSECCKKKDISDRCLAYCTAHDGVPTNYLDYLTCLEDFDKIRDCFQDHLEKN